MRLTTLILAASLLLGCAETTQKAADNAQDVAQEVTRALDDKADEAAVVTAEATTPVVLAVREALEVVAPTPVDPPQVPTQRNDQVAADLIIRWEVGSKARYTKLYQGVICPGGASGPTIGIGYDLGHQTAATIRKDWAWHPQAEDMATGSGQVGPGACNAWKQSHRGIRVTYAEAERVFIEDTLPDYTRMAERALRGGWDGISPGFKAGMKSLGYNRGWSMVGSRNTEKRVIRDTCAPASDADCGAVQVIAMCRLWVGMNIYKGLCDRRKDEARVIRS